jgi:hypothetical protein
MYKIEPPLSTQNPIKLLIFIRTGFITPFWLRLAAMPSAIVALLRHISEQYGCIALRGISHLAQARAYA